MVENNTTNRLRTAHKAVVLMAMSARPGENLTKTTTTTTTTKTAKNRKQIIIIIIIIIIIKTCQTEEAERLALSPAFVVTRTTHLFFHPGVLHPPDYSNENWSLFPNRLFYRYSGRIEFIRFKEYYRMPRGHSLNIYTRFSGKKRTSLYIAQEKAIIITSKHGTTIFFPITIFF